MDIEWLKKREGNPYLLRGFEITSVNQVWSTDITYIPLRQGYMVLTAVMDWHSRYVLSWELSSSLDSEFCVRALEAALKRGSLRYSTQTRAVNLRAMILRAGF